MKFEIGLVFCVMVVLTGSSQTGGQTSALPPVVTLTALSSPAATSESPVLKADPSKEVIQWIQTPAGTDETTTVSTGAVRAASVTDEVHATDMLTTTSAVATSHSMNGPVVMTAQPGTGSSSDSLSSTPAAQSTTLQLNISNASSRANLTRDPLATFSSQPAHTGQVSTRLRSESLTTAAMQRATTTGRPLTSAAGQGPARPTHKEVSSELNVGDEDFKGPHHRSGVPLDPLLAGLLSVFIVTTAVVFTILFLRFRQRTHHPEFQRLQDLPMDDLMEDTPLSRYSY